MLKLLSIPLLLLVLLTLPGCSFPLSPLMFLLIKDDATQLNDTDDFFPPSNEMPS